MSIRVDLLGFWVVTSGALGIPCLGASQQARVTISVTPDSLLVAPGLEDRASLTIANSSDSTLFDVRFTSLAASGIHIRFADARLPEVRAHAVLATILFVARDSNGTRPAAIVIRTDYRSGRLRTPSIVLSSVKLIGSQEAPDQVADVKLSSSTETITEKQPGKVFVIVTNKLDLPLSVGRISSRSPVFTAVDSSLGGSIPPYGSAAFEINLRTPGRLQPGRYPIVFDVALSWPSRTGTRRANVLVPHEVELGVFAEVAVLKVLSVPSFLLLPGFLMIIAYQLMWQFQRILRGAKPGEPAFSPTSPSFWVIAITLSGLMALVYPRDYLTAYGTRDLVEVWLVSTLLGAVVSAAWFNWRYVWTTPTTTDLPVTILRKLARQGLGIEREQVTINGGDTRYLLQRMPEGDDQVWVGAPILLTWQSGATDDDRKRLFDLRTRGKAGPLADYLDEAKTRQVIEIDWRPTGATPRPVSEVTPAGKGQIVEA